MIVLELHLEFKPVEALSAKVGPHLPHKPQVDSYSLYDYKGDGTALVDDPQLNEDTQSEQQQLHSSGVNQMVMIQLIWILKLYKFVCVCVYVCVCVCVILPIFWHLDL